MQWPGWDDFGPRRPFARRFRSQGNAPGWGLDPEEWEIRPRAASNPPPMNGMVEWEMRERLRELEDLRRRDYETRRRKELEEEVEHKRLITLGEEIEREKKEKELKKKLYKEYQLEEERKKVEAKKKKEKEDTEFKERMRRTLWASGYSDEQIERMIIKAEKKHTVEDHHRELVLASSDRWLLAKRRDIDPETLDRFGVPWRWRKGDPDTIIIMTDLKQDDIEILCEHTRTLREVKPGNPSIALRKDNNQLQLVRRRESRRISPSPKARFLI